MSPLINPDVAYLTLVLGVVLAVLASFTPGTGLLEVGAFFALILAGIAASQLQTNIWAIFLLVLGVAPFIIALRRWKNWIFLALAILVILVGSIFMFSNPDGSPAVNFWLAGITSLMITPGLWFIGRKTVDALGQKKFIDLAKLIGAVGETKTAVFKEGTVYVGGEDWTAWSKTEIPAGQRVQVIRRQGLVLEVEPVQEA